MSLAILAILIAITYGVTGTVLLLSSLFNFVDLPNWLLLGAAVALLSWCLGD
ncbi:hypothetical protein K9N68_10695 [Kovacikia minuta CCNUW1]|uniref:hypothetical protein n=1 Tax=Kovacikia minuta TaxID=2931930 RepID=UPI001CCA1BE0|nr:hypothetical protein [Kovacikia minuta]UBF28300.1 hypothetical protein K9N68_10695 [Kovacikia minuta CCNUW1]